MSKLEWEKVGKNAWRLCRGSAYHYPSATVSSWTERAYWTASVWNALSKVEVTMAVFHTKCGSRKEALGIAEREFYKLYSR